MGPEKWTFSGGVVDQKVDFSARRLLMRKVALFLVQKTKTKNFLGTLLNLLRFEFLNGVR